LFGTSPRVGGRPGEGWHTGRVGVKGGLGEGPGIGVSMRGGASERGRLGDLEKPETPILIIEIKRQLTFY